MNRTKYITAIFAIGFVASSTAVFVIYNKPIEFSKSLTDHYQFSEKWISSLTDYQKGNGVSNSTVYKRSHSENIRKKFGDLIQNKGQNPNYTFQPLNGQKLEPFNFNLIPGKDNFSVDYDADRYKTDSRHVSFYFEIDSTPEFNSSLTTRYPNLTPNYVSGGNNNYQKNEFNLSNVTLNIFHAGHYKMFPDGKFELPFNHSVYLASIPEDRVDISLKEMEQISYLLSQNSSDMLNHNQIYQFVKLNHVWGGDTRSRKPIESFVAKTVGCGHMNGVAGMLIELSGDRYRLVSGFDPYVQSYIPGGGHSAIEIYSDETGKWSYLDSFLDIYAPGTPAEKIKGSDIANTFVYKRLINGEEYTVNLEKLFRFRSYGDPIGRRRVTPMTYIAGKEYSYALGWPTEKIRPLSLADIKDKVTIYIRGRYVRASCSIRFLGESSPCQSENVEVSDWTVKSYEISNSRPNFKLLKSLPM